MFCLATIFLILKALTFAHSAGQDKVLTYSKSPWVDENKPLPPVAGGRGMDSKTTARYITMWTRMGKMDVKEMVKDAGRTNMTGEDTPPDDLLHGSIVLFGNVYEFIFDKGIDVTPEAKYYNETEKIWEDANFTTSVTPENLKAWLVKAKTKYRVGKYHVATRNCLHFAKDLTDFLGGTEPPKLKHQREWLTKHTFFGNYMQGMLEMMFELPTPAPGSDVASEELTG